MKPRVVNWTLGAPLLAAGELRWLRGEERLAPSRPTAMVLLEADAEDDTCLLTYLHNAWMTFPKKGNFVVGATGSKSALEAFLQAREEEPHFVVGALSRAAWKRLTRGGRKVLPAFLSSARGKLLWYGEPEHLGRALELSLKGSSPAALAKAAVGLERLEALHREIAGDFTGHREKKPELLRLLSALREQFPRSSAVEDLAEGFAERLLAGEPAPSLRGTKWLGPKPARERRPAVYGLWKRADRESARLFDELAGVQTRFGGQLGVFAVSPNAGTKSARDFLARREPLPFPVGLGAEGFVQGVRSRPHENAEVAVVGAGGDFLWAGSLADLKFVLAALFDKKGGEARLLQLASDCDVFREWQREGENSSVDEASLRAIRPTMDRILAVLPGHREVLSCLAFCTAALGPEAFQRFVESLDTRDFEAEHLFLSAFKVMTWGEGKAHHEHCRGWIERALALEPKVPEYWAQYVEVLLAQGQKKRALEAIEKGLALRSKLRGFFEDKKEQCLPRAKKRKA